eukprot:COSAG02_NODE_7_length_64539_cov_120.393482_46_plen_102_part_00
MVVVDSTTFRLLPMAREARQRRKVLATILLYDTVVEEKMSTEAPLQVPGQQQFLELPSHVAQWSRHSRRRRRCLALDLVRVVEDLPVVDYLLAKISSARSS